MLCALSRKPWLRHLWAINALQVAARQKGRPVKVLLVGTSWTLSVTLPLQERLPTVLAALLQEQFPEQEIAVRTEAWVDFSPPRRSWLLGKIEEQQPDYLLLAPTGVWVTFPLVAPALMRRLPRLLHRPAHRLIRVNRKLDRHLSERGWSWTGYVYKAPLDWLGRIIGAEPLYTVAEALDALEEVILATKRRESTEILMLPRTALPLPEQKMNADPQVERMSRNPYFARIIPPAYVSLWNQFGEGVLSLCRKHRIPCVDIWSGQIIDVNQDGYHPGPETARQQASLVRDAIVKLEDAYRQ